MSVRTRFRLGISYLSLTPKPETRGAEWTNYLSFPALADSLNRPRPSAKTGFHFSLAAAVAGSLAATAVQAGDAVIQTAQTAPAATSRADGSAPGNLTIAAEGSIKVGSGPAVTLDSNHTFTNAGTVEVTGESRAVGVLVDTTRTNAGNVIDNGTITITGPASSSAAWPDYVFNTGIEVSAGGVFNGALTRGAGATLTVGGNGATGIAVLGTMNGGVTNNGAINLGRQDSYGIKTTGAVAGSIDNGGAIEATGQDSVGLYAGGATGGAVINRGSITTGAPATTNSANETVAAVRGGRALWVANNAGGIYLEGNGVTKENEPLALLPEGTPGDSLLSVRGSAEALYIGQGGPAGANGITIGRLAANPDGASIVSRGNIAVESAIKSTTPVRAVNIAGTSASVRTALEGGFRNEGGDITAFGKDSTAQGIRIGEYATVPSLYNSGLIHARGVDSGENAETGVVGAGGGDAYGVIIEQNGALPALINTGKIHADSRGATQSAYAIVDYSGTLASVVNEGQVLATRRGTGVGVALDLSRAAGGASVSNSGSIAGAMIFGAGADTFTSTNGALLGDMSLGAGDDVVSLTNTGLTGILNLGDGNHSVAFTNSTLDGGILLGTAGAASLDVNASTFTIPTTSEVRITDGHIRGGSTITFNIDAQAGTVGAIKAAGALVVDSGTVLKTTITGAVVDQFTVNLIEAGSLSLGADIAGLQPGSTVMYRREIKLADDNANIFQFQITRRTADELALSSTLGAIYDSSIESLGGDTELAGVMAALTDQSKFETALSQLTPDTSDAARRTALVARGLAQSALQRRMSGFLSNRADPLGRFRSGFWLQQLTRVGSADGEGAVPGYSLSSIGIAGGADAQVGDSTIVGFGLGQTFGAAKADTAGEKVKLSTTSLDFYGRTNTDVGYLQATLGYGFNSYTTDRMVEIESLKRVSGGKSPGYQWGATVDAGSHLVTGPILLTGYLRGAFDRIYRHSYEEEGGGPAVNLRYASTSYTSVRAGGGGVAEYRVALGPASGLAFNLHADYAHEFNDTPTHVRARFAAGETFFDIEGMTPARHIVSGGIGAAWEQRLSTFSFDYDAEKAGPYLGHSFTLTYRQRF